MRKRKICWHGRSVGSVSSQVVSSRRFSTDPRRRAPPRKPMSISAQCSSLFGLVHPHLDPGSITARYITPWLAHTMCNGKTKILEKQNSTNMADFLKHNKDRKQVVLLIFLHQVQIPIFSGTPHWKHQRNVFREKPSRVSSLRSKSLLLFCFFFGFQPNLVLPNESTRPVVLDQKSKCKNPTTKLVS